MNHQHLPKLISVILFTAFAFGSRAGAQQKEVAVPEFDCVKAIAEADDIAGIASEFGGDLSIESGKSKYATFIDAARRRLYIVTENGIYSTKIPQATKNTPKYHWVQPKEGWTYQHLIKFRNAAIEGGNPVYIEVNGGGHKKNLSITDHTFGIKTEKLPSKFGPQGWDEDGHGIDDYAQAYKEHQANESLSEETRLLLLKRLEAKLVERRKYVLESALENRYAGGDKKSEREYLELQRKKTKAYLDRISRCKKIELKSFGVTILDFEAGLKRRLGMIETAMGIANGAVRGVAGAAAQDTLGTAH